MPDNKRPHEVIPFQKPQKTLLVFAVIYTLYFAQSLIVPLVFTCLIALLLSPIVTYLQKLYIPRPISSLAILLLFLAPIVLMGLELTEPAQKWAKQIPKLSQELTQQVDTMTKAFEEDTEKTQAQKEEEVGFSLFGWFKEKPEEKKETSQNAKKVTEKLKESSLQMASEILVAAPIMVTQILTSIILILFLLIFSPQLYQSYINSLDDESKKERTVNVVATIQKQLSNYVVTISAINLCLGISTAIALYIVGMQDAILWGALVALMNFIPYVGMVIGMSILALAATVQYGFTIDVLIPLSCYAGLNLLESQFITPYVMGKNMLMNPLTVVLWLLFCGWMWGIVGVLIAVPLLVCLKIALYELNIGRKWISIIESR